VATLGFIDTIAFHDPDSGEARTVSADGGLVFRFSDPANPEAGQLCKLGVRSGGMVVAVETRGTIQPAQQMVNNSTTPLSAEAQQVAEDTAARPTPPVRPGKQQRKPPAATGA
jgi:hypothetical protein